MDITDYFPQARAVIDVLLASLSETCVVVK